MRNGKPSALGAISGAVAGLVAITPASGFVTPMSALVIGLMRRCLLLPDGDRGQGAFGYDDSLDAFGVHGAGGTLGALLTGVFAISAVNPIFHDAAGSPDGWAAGRNAHQLVNQLSESLIAWGLAIVGTPILLKVTDAAGRLAGLRRTRGTRSGPVATRGNRIRFRRP